MAEINSIFNFLKDYNELSNPIITEIDKQMWSMKLLDLPKINEVWSVYKTLDFDGLKILEVERPILNPCPVPNELIIEWLEENWKKLNVDQINHKETISRFLKLYQYSCGECNWKYNPQVGDFIGNIPYLFDFNNISQDWVCPNCKAEKKNFKKEQEIDCYKEEHFNEDENRQVILNKWIIERNSWIALESPKEEGLVLYNKLFKLYSDMKKESESVELILGDGHIYWRTDLRIIDHPVLLQRVQLAFNPEKPSFIVKCDELKTELYTPMLRIIPTINQSMLSEIISDIETNTYRIADTSNTNGLFNRLINVVDEQGKFFEKLENGYRGPIIISQPILFLRKRTLGFSMFIQKIIEDIGNKQNIILPHFFNNIIGNNKEDKEIDIIKENWNQNGIDQDILLTLPANNEQLKIIKYLNKYDAVLVQGPPGTGKTHTIANLIGHLLSQGNSVLVTSQTEKALTVLKEKVYKDKNINLQNLCISLLSTNSQKKEMDEVINEIAIKRTSLDLNETNKKIEILEINRKSLIDKLKMKSKELLQIRSLEYKDIVFANQTITPINAAKLINDGQGKDDFIIGLTYDDTIGLPLSIDDLRALYHSNQQISQQENELLSKELPEIESMWDITDFNKKTSEYLKYNEVLVGWNPKFVIKNDVEDKVLIVMLETAITIVNSLSDMESFQLSIIDKTIKDSIYNTFWTSVFEEFDTLIQSYEVYRKIRFDNNYNLPDRVINIESIAILNEIIGSGKDMPVTLITTITKPKWKKLRDEITNSGLIIEKRVDFENVKSIVQYELQRGKIFNKINKLLSNISKYSILELSGFEEKVKQFRIKISSSLNWHKDIWTKFSIKLLEICDNSKRFEELSVIDLERPIESIINLLNNILIPDLEKHYTFKLLDKLAIEWTRFSNYLDSYKSYGQLYDDLIFAVIGKDISLYTKSYTSLSDVLAKKKIYIKRCKLIEQLKIVAPDWAEAIINRRGIHGEGIMPENIEAAWKWRQLSNQIARIDSYDANIIQKDMSRINEQLMQNARELAYEKAWYKKINKISASQTQAIEGWRQTIRQIGRGTGRTAPELLKKARELMPLCQTTIPVWIMPLNRVAENFDPQKNKFDVVIIDEASQAGILALSVLYLGKKIIIVGDDEQSSPDVFGMKTEDISALIEQHLHGIPNSHLFNEKTSIYDLAKGSGFKPLMLTEHFRCLPEIIEFSNQLSYNGNIKPLRDASKIKVKPSVVELRIPNAYNNDININAIEAEYIASIICACCEEDDYKDKTIGVISLLGKEQGYEIDKILQAKLDLNQYEKRKIQCGMAPQFQGDERDIIFLSIVVGPSERGGPVRLLREDGNNDLNRKKYNVAASRARDQMWVVHSLNPEVDLQPDDIRLKLIRHAINPAIDRNEEIYTKAESDFEKQVIKTLHNKGYKVISQWKAGAYRIDIVIESADIRVAIECDGDKWHTQDDLLNDLKRQAILERLGWKFIRIRGSAFYRRPDETMKWVFNELDNYGIRPNFSLEQEIYGNAASINNEIIGKIKRRAEEIRKEWHVEVNSIGTSNIDKTLNNINIDVITEIIKGTNKTKATKEITTEVITENQDEISLTNTQVVLTEKVAEKKLKKITLKKSDILKNDIQSKQLSLEIPEKTEINTPIILDDIKTTYLSKNEIFSISEDSKNICKLLIDQGYEVIDKRSKGGRLWIVGGEKLSKGLLSLESLGVNFIYAPNGSKTTGNKSAWYSKTDK